MCSSGDVANIGGGTSLLSARTDCLALHFGTSKFSHVLSVNIMLSINI